MVEYKNTLMLTLFLNLPEVSTCYLLGINECKQDADQHATKKLTKYAANLS